jgi:hypothetical protein
VAIMPSNMQISSGFSRRREVDIGGHASKDTDAIPGAGSIEKLNGLTKCPSVS